MNITNMYKIMVTPEECKTIQEICKGFTSVGDPNGIYEALLVFCFHEIISPIDKRMFYDVILYEEIKAKDFIEKFGINIKQTKR